MEKKVIIVYALIGAVALFVSYRIKHPTDVAPPAQPQVIQEAPVVVPPPIVNPPVSQLMPDTTFDGTWVTGGERKRHLNGTMTATVSNPSQGKWKARFFGVWQGQPFTYNVDFDGTPDKLSGTAVVDFVNYTWTGSIVNGTFVGTFKSHRYDGDFNLKEKK